MTMRRRPGEVRPQVGGETFQIIESGTPEYLIPMPKAERVVPLAGDPDCVVGDTIQSVEQGEGTAQDRGVSVDPPS